MVLTGLSRVAPDAAHLIPHLQRKIKKPNLLRTTSVHNGIKAKLQTKQKKTKKTPNVKKTDKRSIAGADVQENP